MKNSYSISKIVPVCVAKVKEIVLEEEGISNNYLQNFVNRCYWKSVNNNDCPIEIGLNQNKELFVLDLPCNVFGDWTFWKNENGYFAFNTLSKEFITALSTFDIYVAITEFQIHYFNYCQQNQKAPKDMILDYSDFMDEDEDCLLMDGEVPHGLVVGELISK